MSIRGKDRRNPVLLFIHGGPGTPMMPMAWAYQTPWEDFFTVVQWDQRGIGKNAVTADRDALTELRTIAPYPREGQTPADMLVVRRWARRYNGGWYGKPDFDLLFSLPEWAPEYTEADLAAQQAASQWFSRTVMRNPLGREPEEWLTIPVPVVVIQGRHDLHTPYESAKAFVERVKAPTVRFITLEHAAHVPMLEEPGRFLLALIQEVLPLAGQGR